MISSDFVEILHGAEFFNCIEYGHLFSKVIFIGSPCLYIFLSRARIMQLACEEFSVVFAV